MIRPRDYRFSSSYPVGSFRFLLALWTIQGEGSGEFPYLCLLSCIPVCTVNMSFFMSASFMSDEFDSLTSHLCRLNQFPPHLMSPFVQPFVPYVTSSPVYVCPQLYTELSQCYQSLISSEADLRQSHQELSSLLAQKEKHILELQAELQQQQQHEGMQLQQQQQQQAQHANRQTNFKVITSPLFHHLSHKGPLSEFNTHLRG